MELLLIPAILLLGMVLIYFGREGFPSGSPTYVSPRMEPSEAQSLNGNGLQRPPFAGETVVSSEWIASEVLAELLELRQEVAALRTRIEQNNRSEPEAGIDWPKPGSRARRPAAST